jgi:hypothetical protein
MSYVKTLYELLTTPLDKRRWLIMLEVAVWAAISCAAILIAREFTLRSIDNSIQAAIGAKNGDRAEELSSQFRAIDQATFAEIVPLMFRPAPVYAFGALTFVSFPIFMLLTTGTLPFAGARDRRLQATAAAAAREVQNDKPSPAVPHAVDIEKDLAGAESDPELPLMEHNDGEHIGGTPALMRKVENRLVGAITISRRKESRSEYQANVLMMIGIFIAVAGVFFFYSQMTGVKLDDITAQAATAPSPIDPVIVFAIESLPKLGVLIFVEMIGIFFLRQYRAMRDEFRYFEAIRRYREDLLSLITYAGGTEEISAATALDRGIFFSSAGVLKNGETTALLEERKLSKAELDVLGQMVGAIRPAK